MATSFREAKWPEVNENGVEGKKDGNIPGKRILLRGAVVRWFLEGLGSRGS